MMNKLITLLILLVFNGCGIFTPRDEFEEPDGNSSIDPFNFDQLLSGQGQHFNSTDPDEIFDTGLIYIDFNTGSERKFSKVQITDNLRILKQNYELSVVWNDSFAEYNYVHDSMFISKVRYRISYKEKNGDSTKYEFGSSDFKLVKKKIWTIYYWADIPDRAGSPSFFVRL